VAEFKEAFSLFDKDGDGNITPIELGNMMRALGYDPTMPELEAIVSDANTSGSGAIDFPEFLMFMGKMQKKLNPDDIFMNAFQAFDTNGNGFITGRELMSVLARVGEKVTEAEVNEMMKRVDKNGEGKLNYEDFLDLMNPQQ
jgi:calmodulin